MNINCTLFYWINRSIISKGMSNIYLNSSYWEKLTFLKFWFSKFKTFVSRSVFGELQLTQILLNFKISWCNLKIRGLEKKPCQTFFYLCFIFGFFMWKDVIQYNSQYSRPPARSITLRGQEFFKKGQPQGRLKQLNVEQDPDHNTR